MSGETAEREEASLSGQGAHGKSRPVPNAEERRRQGSTPASPQEAIPTLPLL